MPESPHGLASEEIGKTAPASGAVSPDSILIVKPSSLGDVVHTLPAVALIKHRWPEARLQWLINPEWAPLLEGNPYVDEVIPFPRREFRGVRGLLRAMPWARQLRERVQADLVLDFQCLLRSALVSKLCRSPAGQIVGLSDAREGARSFYDKVVDVRGREHAVARYLALVETLGIQTDVSLEWPLQQGIAIDGVNPGFVLLHPFSRGAGKSMSVEDVVEFCRVLSPHRVVIAGRTEEPLPPIPNAQNLLNRTSIAELIWLIRQAQFVISVDSGPMHIAAALTPNLLSIHTWSDPRKVGPYRPEAWVWKNGRVSTVAEYASGENGAGISNTTELAAWVRTVLA